MRSLTLDLGGPVHLADFGGEGRPMLLVHGLGGSHVNWLSVGPELAEGHRVLALDLPGFGLSPAAGRTSTLPQSIAALHRVVRHLGEPVVLMGNSMGGLISLGLAASRPDEVAALVLVSPALPQPGRRFGIESLLREYVLVSFPAIATWRLRSAVAAGRVDGVVRAILQQCTVDLDRVDPAVLEAHYELERRRVEHPGWHEPLDQAIRSLLRTLAERSLIERWIRTVTVPTLLTHGARDRVVSVRAAKAAADLRPDWDFHLFEDIGHVPQLEAPQQFVGIVRGWLDGRRGAEELTRLAGRGRPRRSEPAAPAATH